MRSVLILRPPCERELVRGLLCGWGFSAGGVRCRGEREFHEEHFVDEDANQVLYREDHILGQWLLLAWGPAEERLCHELALSLPIVSLAEAQEAAEAAVGIGEQVAALGPLVAQFVEGREVDERTFGLLAGWLSGPEPALRRATLLGAAYLYSPLVDELLEAALGDPSLRAEAQRQLDLRRELAQAESASPEPAAAVEHSELLSRAHTARDRGQLWAGLIYARAALALARREGVRLHELLALCAQLEGALAADSRSDDLGWDQGAEPASLEALACLQVLLDEGRNYEVEEATTALLDFARGGALPARLAVNLLDLLAASLRGRGRADLAASPIERALALLDGLLGREPALTEAWLARARLAAWLGAVQNS